MLSLTSTWLTSTKMVHFLLVELLRYQDLHTVVHNRIGPYQLAWIRNEFICQEKAHGYWSHRELERSDALIWAAFSSSSFGRILMPLASLCGGGTLSLLKNSNMGHFNGHSFSTTFLPWRSWKSQHGRNIVERYSLSINHLLLSTSTVRWLKWIWNHSWDLQTLEILP